MSFPRLTKWHLLVKCLHFRCSNLRKIIINMSYKNFFSIGLWEQQTYILLSRNNELLPLASIRFLSAAPSGTAWRDDGAPRIVSFLYPPSSFLYDLQNLRLESYVIAQRWRCQPELWAVDFELGWRGGGVFLGRDVWQVVDRWSWSQGSQE